ncbi:MAG TPA: methyltransferase domain-containing protein [Gaiellaceae bacterium]|nr:methyltransferase domain-containing protein [Gaiellaceae bacterium]
MEPTEENLKAFDALHRARHEPDELPAIVVRTLGDLTKKKVLHLLCSTGEATAALADLGAVVTGMDPRHESLEAARELRPDILWVNGDPQDLRGQLGRRKFDLVYSGEGVLDRVGDVARWAEGIASVLKPAGELLVFDDHPVADCVDGLLRWRSDYFRDPADPNRLWRLGQIVSALVRAGIQVRALEEYPGGTSRRGHDRRVPATFLLYGRRSA